jgi:hypothetical protein
MLEYFSRKPNGNDRMRRQSLWMPRTRTPLPTSERARTPPPYLHKKSLVLSAQLRRAARRRQHTCPPWPSLAGGATPAPHPRCSHAPTLDALRYTPPSRAMPPSTSPIVEGEAEEACACAWESCAYAPMNLACRQEWETCTYACAWVYPGPLTSCRGYDPRVSQGID